MAKDNSCTDKGKTQEDKGTSSTRIENNLKEGHWNDRQLKLAREKQLCCMISRVYQSKAINLS